MATEATHQPMPPGILVRASRQQLVRSFGAVAPLQPTGWTDDGLVCTPRAAPEIAGPALDVCPLPTEALDYVPTWPSPPSLMISGWYRRSTTHAPGPNASQELVQSDGDGFGPLGHPTTAMCLTAIADLPHGPALDVGCGSGLLAQAWAKMTGMPVMAIDADPAATAHARTSIESAGLTDTVTVRQTQISALRVDDTRGRVILANIPAPAHTSLLDRVSETPPGVILSGLTTRDSQDVVGLWRARGMRLIRASQRGRWRCFGLVAS